MTKDVNSLWQIVRLVAAVVSRVLYECVKQRGHTSGSYCKS